MCTFSKVPNFHNLLDFQLIIVYIEDVDEKKSKKEKEMYNNEGAEYHKYREVF